MKTRIKLLLALTLTFALAAPGAFAETDLDPLRIIPGDSMAVGSVNIASLRSSPLSGTIFDKTDKMTTDGEASRFLEDAGFDPLNDVDVMTVAYRTRKDGLHGDVLVVAEGHFDSQRIIVALVARGASPVGTNNGTYFTLPDNHDEMDDETGALAFVGNNYVVLGNESAVKGALNAVARGGTGFPDTTLGKQMSRIDRAAQAWFLVDVARMSNLMDNRDQGDAVNVFAAVKNMTYAGMWTTDTGDSIRIGGIALSEDEETRSLLEDTIKGALASARLAAQQKDPELVKVLRQATVSRDSEGVTFKAEIPAEFIHRLRTRATQTAEAR